MDVILNLAVVSAALVAVIATARLALTPRLGISDFAGGKDEDLHAGLPRIIHSELEILRAEGGGTTLRFMTGPDKPIDIPEPVTKLTGLGSIVQLLQLLPRRTHTVDAFVHANTPRGPALSIRLSRSELADAATTLYLHDLVKPIPTTVASADRPPATPEPDGAKGTAEGSPSGTEDEKAKEKPKSKPEPSQSSSDEPGSPESPPATTDANAYYRLAVAAAAWLAFRLPKRDAPASATAMLTNSWESYALFRIGVDYQQASDLVVARKSYAESLMHDPLNRGSLHNLAGLDIGTRCNGPAIDRLLLLLEILPDADMPLDRLWYRARFNLAVACLNEDSPLPGRLECESPFGLVERRKMAAAAIEQVIGRSKQVIEYYDAAGPRAVRRTASPELLTFLKTLHDMALIVKADIGARPWPDEPESP